MIYKLAFKTINDRWQISKDNNYFHTREEAAEEAGKRVIEMLLEFNHSVEYKIIEKK